MDFQYDELSQIFEDEYYEMLEKETEEESSEELQLQLAQNTSFLAPPVEVKYISGCDNIRGLCLNMGCQECTYIRSQALEKKVDLDMVVYCKKMNLTYEYESVYEWDWYDLKVQYGIHPSKK